MLFSPHLKALVATLVGVAALCVVTSHNGLTATLEKAKKDESGSEEKDLEALMAEAEGNRQTQPLQSVISSVHTLATMKARGMQGPLESRARTVLQQASGMLRH